MCNTVSVTVVPDEERVGYLEACLGPGACFYEAKVCHFMRQFCDGYTGGIWDLFRLSNHGLLLNLQAIEYGRHPDVDGGPRTHRVDSTLANFKSLKWLSEHSQPKIPHYDGLLDNLLELVRSDYFTKDERNAILYLID